MAGDRQYDNTNKGALFIKKDRSSDRSPNMTGKLNVGGRDYYISGWTCYKRSDGEKYLQLSVTPVDEVERAWAAGKSQADGHFPAQADKMDDVPF